MFCRLVDGMPQTVETGSILSENDLRNMISYRFHGCCIDCSACRQNIPQQPICYVFIFRCNICIYIYIYMYMCIYIYTLISFQFLCYILSFMHFVYISQVNLSNMFSYMYTYIYIYYIKLGYSTALFGLGIMSWNGVHIYDSTMSKMDQQSSWDFWGTFVKHVKHGSDK
jgi:hypothetical protein